MRHITSGRLDELEPLLGGLRELDALTERKRGVFYRGSKAFLHFHEDGDDDYYADVKLDGVMFERLRVTTKSEQARLVRLVRATLDQTRAGNAARSHVPAKRLSR
jgi:hypothetical protein